jgi:hypothetical protein
VTRPFNDDPEDAVTLLVMMILIIIIIIIIIIKFKQKNVLVIS